MFKNLKISARLSIMAVFILFALGSIAYYVGTMTHHDLFETRKLKTKNLVETAMSVMKEYDALAEAGKITKEEAKQYALRNIEMMRYDDGTGYFFVFDLDGILKMHVITSYSIHYTKLYETCILTGSMTRPPISTRQLTLSRTTC